MAPFSPSMLSLRRLPLLLAASLLGPVLAGTARADDPLAGDSPFLPPAAAGGAEATQTPDAALELRGVVTGADGAMFSIFDPAHRTSTWTRLNDTSHPFIVRSYDSSRDAVTVDFQGRTVTLVLKTAKVVSAPLTPPPMIVNTAMPPPGGPQPIGGPVVLNPTPADEQRRLEAIAAEVNRRRMIRQQALQNQRLNAGQPPANQPVGPGLPPQQR